MHPVLTAREAKEFLVGRIVAEAQCEGVSLSGVETKMMYFSETGWTLPDIEEVNEAFDKDYDLAVYERKIGGLARNFCSNARKAAPAELEQWNNAVQRLSQEDHYLLVLISSGGQTGVSSSNRALQLVMMGVGLGCAILGTWALWILLTR